MSSPQARIEQGLAGAPLPPLTHIESIDAARARLAVPGVSVCVFRGGEIEWAAGYGLRECGRPEPITTKTIFQACSISKPVAAMAAMRLVQAGELDLDDDINTRLRSWRVPANAGWQPRVTLRHLLTHSAGISSCWYPGYLRGAVLPTLLQTLQGEPPANTPPVRVTTLPGATFRYSGAHYSVLQQLLEDVTGQPFTVLTHELVLEPLRMAATSYDQWFPETYGDVALGHNVVGEVLEGGWRLLPEMAGAGMWTTPSDLARIALDISASWRGEAGVLLHPDLARATLTPGIGGRGLGWVVFEAGGRTHFGHGGDNIGYKCGVLCDAERGDGIAVMSNGDGGGELCQAIVHAAAREYGWDLAAEEEDPFRMPLPPALPLNDIDVPGEYVTEDALSFTLAEHDRALCLHFSDQPPLPLRRIGPGQYAAEALNVRLSIDADTCVLRLNDAERSATRV